MPVLPAITWPLAQKASYWPITGIDDFGNEIFGTVIEIDCRWDEEQIEFLTGAGEKGMSKAVVMVDRKLPQGALVQLTIAELTSTTEPYLNGAWLIRGYTITPDLDANEALYTVFL